MTKQSLEDEPEGELHLPPSLLAGIPRKPVVGICVVEVSIRERAIHVVQHVIRREAKLNIERFTDSADGEVLVQRRIPVKLLPSTEDVAAQRTDFRRRRAIREGIRIAGEDSRGRTSKRIAIELKPLISLRLSRSRIANEIDAATITRDIEYWTTLPGDDVIELPSTDSGIEGLVHVTAVASVTTERNIQNIRERETMPDVRV